MRYDVSIERRVDSFLELPTFRRKIDPSRSKLLDIHMYVCTREFFSSDLRRLFNELSTVVNKILNLFSTWLGGETL